MKKRLYLLLMFVLLLCVITGCEKKEESSSGTNTSSGVNTSDDLNETIKEYTSKELAKNITSSGAMTNSDTLVVFVNNNNNVPVDMDIEVEFYDKDGMIVGSDSDNLIGVGANSEIAVEMYSTPDSFDNYKIYVDVEQCDEISYMDKVELIHNNNGEEIVVQVKNNSDDLIEFITVAVVYYKNEKVVGISDGITSDIKSGRSANFTLSYPYDSQYNTVRFDTYKVFVTGAYTYKW